MKSSISRYIAGILICLFLGCQVKTKMQGDNKINTIIKNFYSEFNGGRDEVQSKVLSTDKGAGIVSLPYNTGLLKVKIKDGSIN
jgi:predicted metalloprotease with PDZ domain